MAKSAVVVDKEYLKHFPGEQHPERAERIQTLLELAQTLDHEKFALVPPRSATRSEVELIHEPEYVRLVGSTAKMNQFALDGDTITSRDSFAVGLLAVGGLLRIIDAIAAGECQNGFALVRPPGHHALRERAMGFCLFNTIAIGAQYLKLTHGAKRVLIMDWDVHHGNGTQAAFYDDPTVMFISTHQYPYYPGSGAFTETGAGAGEGFTVNIPLPAGCADAEYLQVFQDIVTPTVEKFQPEWILVSAGFDPHGRDPLGGMGVTEEGFGAMAKMLLALADRFASARIVFLLEGGYDLTALRSSVIAVLAAMQTGGHSKNAVFDRAASGIETVIRRVRQVHDKYQ